MGRQDDNFIIILDANKVFSFEELEIVKSTENLTEVEVETEN
jgi:hypothetical protein